MNTEITRAEARDMAEAHGQGLHEGLPREGCPDCEGRELSDYPTRTRLELLIGQLEEPSLGLAGYGIPDPRDPDGDWLVDAQETPQAATAAAIARLRAEETR